MSTDTPRTDGFPTAQWRPIETAPKAFFRVILLGRVGGTESMPCYWDGEHWKCASLFGQGLIYVDPTHWMPLPEGPNDA